MLWWGQLTGKKRCRHRFKDNIKMDPKGIDRVGVDWVNVIQDRRNWWAVLNMVMIIGFRKMGDIS